MGVSQWKEYGKKYGYWNFFKAQMLEIINDMSDGKTHKTSEEYLAYEQAIDDFKEKIEKL